MPQPFGHHNDTWQKTVRSTKNDEDALGAYPPNDAGYKVSKEMGQVNWQVRHEAW